MADYETLSVSDKVGIGTESPLAQLHIASSTSTPSQAFLESGGALLKITVDSSGASIGTDNAFPFKILTDNSSRLSITDDGKVGIGTTTTPTERLEVNGNVKANSFFGNGADLDGIVKKAGDNTMTGSLTINNNLTVNGAIATPQLTVKEQGITFVNRDNDGVEETALVIQGNGNIGIGTTEFTEKLAVAGKVKATDLEVSSAIAASTLTVTGDANIDGNLKIDGNLEVMGDVTARDVEHVFGNVSFGDADDDEVKITGVLRSGHSSGVLRVDDALHTTGSLTVDGNVGIGTNSPVAKLNIVHQPQDANGNTLILGTTNASNLRLGYHTEYSWIQSHGRKPLSINPIVNNVGIGTTSPVAKLNIVHQPQDANGNTLILGTTNASNLRLGYHTEYSWIQSHGRKPLAINPIGNNVGIGTTTPSSPLEIVSKKDGILRLRQDQSGHPWNYIEWYNSNSRLWWSGTTPQNTFAIGTDLGGGRVLSLSTNGNVGIGTTSPTFKLDVRGNNGWIGSADSSQSQGGWRLGRWPAYSPNTWVYLVRADSRKYQDLAVGALWAGGALRFGSADDLAEMTPVKAEDNLEPGDVVVIENPPDNRVLLAKSNKPDDSKVAGVISDPSTAGLIIGGSHPTDVNRDDLKPLALAGRVLTKVTTENGSINAGDFLTTSHTPGCAMKANIPCYSLGKALQCFNGNENDETTGKIWVLVNLGWVGGVTKE